MLKVVVERVPPLAVPLKVIDMLCQHRTHQSVRNYRRLFRRLHPNPGDKFNSA